MLPMLCALTLAVALPYGQPPLVLWPRNALGTPDISGLRRLTLSSSSAEDQIFVHIPPDLEELSLRDVPRFYTRSRISPSAAVDRTYAGHVLSCSAALSIFRTMPRLTCLHHLELALIEDERELDLFAYIAAACPQLSFLELHCYRNVSAREDINDAPLLVSLDALGQALSAFPTLRVVRLNIDLPWGEFSISKYCGGGRRDGVTYTYFIAQTIARAVPWIDAVCALTCTPSDSYEWRIWTVRTRDGAVELEEHENLRGLPFWRSFDN